MKKLLTISVLAALTVGIASAQYTRPMGLSVRGGLFMPQASAPRDLEGDTWYGIGLEYRLGDLQFGMADPGFAASYSISIDYYGKGDFSAVPILLNYVGRNNQFYYSAGAGIALTRRPGLNGGTTSDGQFAYQFSVGYDLALGATPMFVEARWMGNAKSDLNGFALLAGFRF